MARSLRQPPARSPPRTGRAPHYAACCTGSGCAAIGSRGLSRSRGRCGAPQAACGHDSAAAPSPAAAQLRSRQRAWRSRRTRPIQRATGAAMRAALAS
eukprot:691145-Pleurochrysis_carterae.AAC.1